MAQTVKNLPSMQETWVRSLGWEDPPEKEMELTPAFVSGKSHGQRSLGDDYPRSHKGSDPTERLTLTSLSILCLQCLFLKAPAVFSASFLQMYWGSIFSRMPPWDCHAEFDSSFLLFFLLFLASLSLTTLHFNDWINPLPFPLKGEILQVLAYSFHVYMLNTEWRRVWHQADGLCTFTD